MSANGVPRWRYGSVPVRAIWLQFEAQSGRIICVRIIAAYALRLNLRQAQRVRRCPL